MPPNEFTKVTPVSKLLTFLLLIILPLVTFYLGLHYKNLLENVYNPDSSARENSITQEHLQTNNTDSQNATQVIKGVSYRIKKNPGNTGDKNSFTYELWKKDKSAQESKIYSIANWFGFRFSVSEDGTYIAILNYGESMGDEQLTLIKSDGSKLNDFGHLGSPQSLIPVMWTDHFYWIIEGVPIGDPTGVLRINAETLKVDRYKLI